MLPAGRCFHRGQKDQVHTHATKDRYLGRDARGQALSLTNKKMHVNIAPPVFLAFIVWKHTTICDNHRVSVELYSIHFRVSHSIPPCTKRQQAFIPRSGIVSAASLIQRPPCNPLSSSVKLNSPKWHRIRSKSHSETALSSAIFLCQIELAEVASYPQQVSFRDTPLIRYLPLSN